MTTTTVAPAKGKAARKGVSAQTPTVAILTALDSALSKVRTLNPDVPTAVAITLASGKGKTHGHVAPARWLDGEGETQGSARHELNMATESFKRGAELTLVTLIHEAAHLASIARGVQDTSRQGRYHNRVFRDTAEEFGLTTDSDDKIGYVTTGLQTWAAEAYKVELAVLAGALTTWRVLETKPKAKKTTIKVGCECETDSGSQATVTVPEKWFGSYGPFLCESCDNYLRPV